METPQAPQVSVSGQIVIEGQLHSSTPSPQQPSPQPEPPPWWKFWKWRPESVLAGATIVLAAATFLLPYMAWNQTAILATTDKSTRKAAEAAGKSAGAAETALQLTKQEQRPIIWLTNDEETPKFVLDELPSDATAGQILWKWHFTNYGKTPALHVSFRSFMVIENKREESFGQPSEGIAAAPMPPGKHDFSDGISPPGIKPEQFAELMKTEQAIGIEGEIIYYDAAGANIRPPFA